MALLDVSADRWLDPLGWRECAVRAAAVAERFGAETVALRATWDIFGEGWTFPDPISPNEARRREDVDRGGAARPRQSTTITGRRH
jgi:hypothetical protein